MESWGSLVKILPRPSHVGHDHMTCFGQWNISSCNAEEAVQVSFAPLCHCHEEDKLALACWCWGNGEGEAPRNHPGVLRTVPSLSKFHVLGSSSAWGRVGQPPWNRATLSLVQP